jgi:hypothetical protein
MPELLHDPWLGVEELNGQADQPAARHSAGKVFPVQNHEFDYEILQFITEKKYMLK